MTLPMNTIAATGPPLVPTSKTPWLLLAYLALCFHHCGAVLMLHFFNYPGFRMIDENGRRLSGAPCGYPCWHGQKIPADPDCGMRPPARILLVFTAWSAKELAR